MNAEIKRIIQHARCKGWKVEMTNSHHVRFMNEDVRIISPSTPSDHRAIENLKATLRRAGLDLPRKNHKKKESR